MSAWERKLFANELAEIVRDLFEDWNLEYEVRHKVIHENFGNERMTVVEWCAKELFRDVDTEFCFQLRITQYNRHLFVDPTVITPSGKHLVFKNQLVAKYGYPISETDWQLIEYSFQKDWYPGMKRVLKNWLARQITEGVNN